MIDFTQFPSPCYIMEEELLRKNLCLIKSVADRAGVEIILAFKSFAMNMNFYSSRNDIHALGINQFCSDNRQVAVSHFQNFMITNKYGPILQPALRGKDARINDLC